MRRRRRSGVRDFKPVDRVDGKVTLPPPPSILVAGVEGPGRRSGRSRASLSVLRKRETKRDSLQVATRVSTTKEKRNPRLIELNHFVIIYLSFHARVEPPSSRQRHLDGWTVEHLVLETEEEKSL